MPYKVREKLRNKWAYGAATNPRFAATGGKIWNDITDVRSWLDRHRQYALPNDHQLEIVEFKLRMVGIVKE